MTVHAALADRASFTIDEGVAALIDRRMLSSSGAVGEEALRRSTRQDRSRDPLFNQFKMLSELYRLLGWLHATTAKAHFRCTELGRYVATYDGDVRRRLIEESLLGIALPSSHSENLGVLNLRPFAKALELMLLVGDEIARDELILGLYTMADDLEPKALAARADLIGALRADGRYSEVDRLLVAAADGRQVNTLKNYTRFILGSIRRIGWTQPGRKSKPYDRSVKFDRLTPHGHELAVDLSGRVDVRASHIGNASVEARSALCIAAHFGMLQRVGVPLQPQHVSTAQAAMTAAASEIAVVSNATFDRLEFSPYQQADAEALAAAEES